MTSIWTSNILIKQKNLNANILHIETATSTCSVALSKDGKLISTEVATESNMHTKRINLMIEELLSKNALEINELSAISVSIGPGSYTGLRVGLSAAKGLAFALDTPLIGISTLEALAQPFLENSKGKSVISAIDARRNEVYMAIFDSSLNLLEGDHCLIIEENAYPDNWPAAENLIVCGNGANKIGELLGDFPIESADSECDASQQALLAYTRFKDQKFDDIIYLKPNYLKPPNITQSKKKLF